MSKLPSPDIIKKVTDVKNLQEACLTLLRVVEKERESKVKYRNSATLLKQEVDAVKLEYQCLREKNDALLECLSNSQNPQSAQNPQSFQNSQSDQIDNKNDNSEMKEKLSQSEKEITELKAQIEELKTQNSEEQNAKYNSLAKKNLELEQAKILLESKILEKDSNIKSLQNQIKQDANNYQMLKNEKEASDMKLKSCEEKVSLLQSHLSQMKMSKNDQNDNSNNNNIDSLNDLNEQIQILKNENTEFSRKLLNYSQLQNENKEIKEQYQNEIQNLTNQNQELTQKVNQLESQAKLSEISLQTAQLDSQSELARLTSENHHLKEILEKTKNDNGLLNSKIKEYEQKINDFETSNLQLTNDQKTLVSITENNKQKAKERIKKLQIEKNHQAEEHQAEIEKITAEHVAKTNELNETIAKLQESKKNSSEKHKEKLTKLRNTKAKFRSNIEILKQEVERLRNVNNDLDIKLHDSNSQNEMMIHKITEFEKAKDDREDLISQNNSLNSKIQKMNIEIYELKEQIQTGTDFHSAVNDREQTINKLKAQIQVFIKNDKEKSEKIHKMQDELCLLTEKIGILSSGKGNNRSVEELAKIEKEKADLEDKIKNSEATQEMIRKNQRLNDMIEKSNKLYIQLKEENEQLREQLQKIQKPKLSLNKCQLLFEFLNENHKQNETSNNSQNESQIDSHTQKVSKRESKKSKEEKKMAQNAYLRRVLLQFFTEEEKNRKSMIPIILKLVSCNDEQIAVVVRQWERSGHLISGFFGF